MESETIAEGAAPAARRSRIADPGFFLGIALILLALVFFGFSQSLYLRGSFPQPPILADENMTATLYMHGAALTAWFVILVVQTLLVNGGRTSLHRKLGLWSLAIAAAVIATSIPVIFGFTARVEKVGMPVEQLIPFLSGLIWLDIFTITAFAGLVGFAILRRNDPALHKRLIIIASISFMPPAVFRGVNAYFPGMPAMDISLATVAILIAAVLAHDLVKLKHVHKGSIIGAVVVTAAFIAGFGIGGTEFGQAFVAGLR